jgi:glycosyltransferase involved in cell wall biosynthesis
MISTPMHPQDPDFRYIFFICHSLSGGGAETALIELLNNWPDTHSMQPVLLLRKRGIFYDSLSEKIERHFVESFSLPNLFRLSKSLNTCIEHYASPCAVVTVMSGITRSVLRLKAIGLFRYPVISWEQNNIVSNTAALFRNRFRRDLFLAELTLTYRLLSGCIFCSKGVKQSFSPLLSCALLKNSVVIYNPIRFREIRRLSDTSEDSPLLPSRHLPYTEYIVAIGRLVHQKNYDEMIAIFSGIKSIRSNAKLLIFGDGPLRTSIINKINVEGLDNDIFLLGFSKNPWVHVKQASLFLLTSSHEGLANVLVEAHSLGCPVLSSDCPYGPREIHDITGIYLYQPGNISQAIELSCALISKTLPSTSGDSCFDKTLSTFSAKNAVNKFCSYITAIVG